jgi:hypothetical protein
MTKCALFSILCATVAATALSQLKSGALGLTMSLSQSPNIGLAYAASENTRIAASIGFDAAKDSSGTTSSYRFSTSIWRYILSSDNIASFFGGSIGLDADSKPAGTVSSVSFGPLFGAEYWFSKRFAVFGMFQVAFQTGKSFGTNVTRLSSSAQTGLTWYF